MAQIKKLQLQGVRSFGPDEGDRQNVEFFSPLTLILGQNGCGKTTIIECLKYVTTGDPPPGSKSGQSFVHDPKMAKETSVRAQVKLLFKGVGNQDKIVSRSIEAQQKLKNITVKTLDGTISTRKPDGSHSNISSKCADINAEMFNSLGVSKAILNYVIFCHQEDSNWPLEEGSKVKDKFDEIFNSAKYKNCLKNIKDVRKKEMDQAKIDKNSMEFYRSDNEMSEEKGRELRKRSNDVQKLQGDVATIEEQLKPLEDQLRKIKEKEINFSGILEKKTQAETNLMHSRKEREMLENQMSEIFPDNESDRDIESRRDGVNEAAKKHEREIQLKQQKIEDFKKQEQKLDLEGKKNAAKIGKSMALKEQFIKDQKTRKDTARNALDNLGLEEDETDDFSHILKKEEARLKKEAKKVKGEEQEKEDKIIESIDEIKGRVSRLSEGKKREQSEMMTNKKDIAKITRQLNELEGAAAKLTEVKEQWTKGQKELEKEKGKVDEKELQSGIEVDREEVRDLEQKERRLKEELKVLEEKQSVLQEMDFLSKDIETKENKMKKIMTKRNSEFIDLFGAVPDGKRLREKYREGNDNARDKLKCLENDKKKKETQLGGKKSVKIDGKKETDKKQRRMQGLEEKVGDVLGEGEDIDEELEKVKEELEEARIDLQVKEAGKYTYKEMLDRMTRMVEPACPTCSREFAKKNEAAELKQDLEDKIAAIPGKVKSLQLKVKQKTARMENLQKVRPEVAALVQIKKEVEEGTSRIQDLEKDIRKLEGELKEEAAELTRVEGDVEGFREVGEDVQIVDGLVRELKVLEEKKADVSAKAPAVVGGRDLGTVREEEEECGGRLRRKRKELDGNQERLNTYRQVVNKLETMMNKLTEKKLDIEKQQQERAATLAKKEELEEKVKKSQEEVAKCDVELGPLREEEGAKNEEKAKIKREGEKRMEKIDEKIKKVERYLGDVDRLDIAIREYEEKGGDQELVQLREAKKVLEDEMQKIRGEKGEEEDSVAKHKEAIAGQEARKRLCTDNLKYRKYKKEEREADRKIKEAESLLEDDEYQQVDREKRKLNQKYSQLEAERNSKSGRVEEMKRSVREIEKELKQPKLRDAAQKFKETNVKFKVRTLVAEDMNKYYVALDYAIMQYHREKMKVVNKFIKELWKQTYRGNDIDYIEIKSDDTDITAGADKRKVYNYRVVMVRNDSELDMRGRCSAGQKVLASLIIRLALAETFSANCGIIALDEPTTNLDRENIESLAGALAEIANKRGGQRNFQLVVITHDEEFIEMMQRCDQITHYQKVSRNARGLSEIRKLAVSDLGV